MCLDKMKQSVNEVYTTELTKQSWTTQSYQYEEIKARLVNKVKHLLPFVLGDVDQVDLDKKKLMNRVVLLLPS